MLIIIEIIKAHQYDEFNSFIESHIQGGFTQLTQWQQVKNNWGFEGVVCRGKNGEIKGAMAVLIQKIPLVGTSFLYSPRGPVCNIDDYETLKELKTGADMLAKKHKAHIFKMDPDVLVENTDFIEFLQKQGFKRLYGPEGFEGIQARFNHRLYIKDKTQEQILAEFNQQTRRNIRKAQKAEVEIKVVGVEYLEEFSRLMKITGERDGFAVRPTAYFKRFLEALGEKARLYIAFYDGKAIAGAISTNSAGKVCYVYGASDNEYRDAMPNYLMQFEMIKWAVETNCFIYDFQGISGNLEDESNHLFGLYRFKRGFGGQVDELVGEFDFVYRPISAKLVDLAIWANEFKRKLKR